MRVAQGIRRKPLNKANLAPDDQWHRHDLSDVSRNRLHTARMQNFPGTELRPAQALFKSVAS